MTNQASFNGIDGVALSIILSDVDLDGDGDILKGGNDGSV